jgi:hypothetical protein
MLSTMNGIVLALGLLLIQAGSAMAEPSYLIYPANVPTVFRYDIARYELIGSDQSKFDPSYAVGNYMLWDRTEQRVPIEIYGAPQLTGFEPAVGVSEFVTHADEFDLIVDGFGTGPRTIGNLCLRFWPHSSRGLAAFTIDGVLTSKLTVPIASIEAITPVTDKFYTGSALHHVSWSGASSLEIVAFSDKDGDDGFQGTPAFRIVAKYSPVATESTSWGKVKALYR